jgi:hypothetical protein
VLTSFIVICLVTAIWATLSALTIAYILSIPYSCILHARFKRQSETTPVVKELML